MSIKRKVELESKILRFESDMNYLRELNTRVFKLVQLLESDFEPRNPIFCTFALDERKNELLETLFSVYWSFDDFLKEERAFLELNWFEGSFAVQEKVFNKDLMKQFCDMLKDHALPRIEKEREEAELNLKELTEELNEVLTSSEIIYFGSQIISLLKQLLENKKGKE